MATTVTVQNSSKKKNKKKNLRKKKQAALAKTYGDQMLQRYGQDVPELLKCMVNPEQYGPCAYPDGFGEDSALGVFIYNDDLTLDASGNFYAKVNPTLCRHVEEGTLAPVDSAHMYSWTGAYNFNDTIKDPSGPTISSEDGSAVIDGSFADFRMRGVPTDTSGTSQLKVLQWNQIQLPVSTSAHKIRIPQADTYIYSPALVLQAVDSTGAVFNPVGSTSFTTLTVGATWVKIMAMTTISGSAAVVRDCLKTLSGEIQVTLGSGTDLVRMTSNVQDYPDLLGTDQQPPVYTEYRTVAMSVLLSFKGDLIANGGTVTARYVKGGENSDALGWVDYKSIAGVKKSYDGALCDGVYAIWRATDTKDMQFRAVDTVNQDGDLPCIVIAGTAVHPATTMRLRVCQCIEAKTYKSYINTEDAPIAPHQIEFVNAALRQFPLIQANPIHLQAVADFLKSFMASAREKYQKVKPVVDFAIDAGRALAPLMSTLL